MLAFAAGALTGAAGMLTLRRRWQEADTPTDEAGAQLGQSAPPLGGRYDSPSQKSVSTPAAQQG
ncbi:hypothetical protein [Micromonospora sp. U21]|uniref:hypothetical protein n=1 Tax=Micromonospora sp. U21 TaxID=2824899 RepID=UPI001B358659|nr:hypothetical protein [Micromonospora sp. U21]MBQ0906545.1 hypothetical protein [Micromonospora sp. U21]